MARYYGLMVRDERGEPWHFEFGDFDRSTVQAEREDYWQHGYKNANMKIVVFNECPSASEIDDLVKAWNVGLDQ